MIVLTNSGRCALYMLIHSFFYNSSDLAKFEERRTTETTASNMDPLSITAGLLSVIDVALRTTTALTKYARDTKSASSDRKLLAEETLFLSKLLQRLHDHAEKARSDETWLADHRDIVRQFEAAYDDLAMTLRIDTVTGQIKQESKLRVARTMLTWSFSKSEIYSLLERITRLQQYANLLLTDDQQSVIQFSFDLLLILLTVRRPLQYDS